MCLRARVRPQPGNLHMPGVALKIREKKKKRHLATLSRVLQAIQDGKDRAHLERAHLLQKDSHCCPPDSYHATQGKRPSVARSYESLQDE